jgi:hypothetical protein
MDAAHDDRMILESAFAAELARQFEAAADAAASRTRRPQARRSWLFITATLAALCVAVVVGSVLSNLGGETGSRRGLLPSTSAPSHQRKALGGPAPMHYGDELFETAPGAAGHVWAWGVTYGTDKQHPGGPLLEVGDGQRWSRLAVPGNEVYGVAEPAPGDVWAAVTKRQGGRLAHWDGSRWRLYAAMSFTGTTEVSNVLLAFSPHDVWAVGDAGLDPGVPASRTNLRRPWLRNHLTALHWDGTSWRSVAMPSLGPGDGEVSVRLLRGSAPDSIWALGEYTQYRRKLVDGKREWVGSGGGEFLLHWDGRRWSRQPLPNGQLSTNRRDSFALDDMAPAPDGSLWCSGRRWFGPDNKGDLFVPVVLRLQDGRWRITASSATATPLGDWRDVMLSSISLTSERDVWISGHTESSGARSVLWHWDGSSWSTTHLDTSQLPGRSYVSRVLALAPHDVWALCNGSTTEDGLQSGQSTSFLPNSKEGVERLQPSFLHFNGSAWLPIIPPTAVEP